MADINIYGKCAVLGMNGSPKNSVCRMVFCSILSGFLSKYPVLESVISVKPEIGAVFRTIVTSSNKYQGQCNRTSLIRT